VYVVHVYCKKEGTVLAITTTAKEFALLSQLQSEGIPLDGEVLEEMRAACAGLDIVQNPIAIETRVFDLDSGGTGYMLSSAIHNESQLSIRLHAPRLKIPWWEPDFHWLVDPRCKVPREYTYSFPDPGPTGFERDAVLNHRLGHRDRGLDPDEWLEGLFLGVGREPIPEEYHDRQRIEMPLSIFDGRGNKYELNAAFLVSRSKRRSVSIAKEIKRGRLFASVDGRRTEVATGVAFAGQGEPKKWGRATWERWIRQLGYRGRVGRTTQRVAASRRGHGGRSRRARISDSI
jgi:hypothetical protein